MSAEEHKAMVCRFVDEFQSQGRVEVVDELVAPDFVNHSPVPGIPADREGVKQLFAVFRTAFPDFRAIIHDQIAEGDRVVTRKSFLGTHQGVLMGIPPSGTSVTIDVIDAVRIVNGQIVKHWNVVDNLGLLQQLGAIPTPEQASA